MWFLLSNQHSLDARSSVSHNDALSLQWFLSLPGSSLATSTLAGRFSAGQHIRCHQIKGSCHWNRPVGIAGPAGLLFKNALLATSAPLKAMACGGCGGRWQEVKRRKKTILFKILLDFFKTIHIYIYYFFEYSFSSQQKNCCVLWMCGRCWTDCMTTSSGSRRKLLETIRVPTFQVTSLVNQNQEKEPPSSETGVPWLLLSLRTMCIYPKRVDPEVFHMQQVLQNLWIGCLVQPCRLDSQHSHSHHLTIPDLDTYDTFRLGQFHASQPGCHWVSLPEAGVRLKNFSGDHSMTVGTSAGSSRGRGLQL